MSGEHVTCPSCWQSIEVELPAYDPQPVMLTTDCEVCCRPMRITYSWGSSQAAPHIEVDPES